MSVGRWIMVGGVIVLAATALALFVNAPDRTSAESPAPAARGPEAIGCLGRIEPEDGVVRLAARSLSGQPSIVGQLLVREGDAVSRGRVLGELDSRPALEAARRTEEARIEVARTRLAQVQAGAKPAEIAAQRAEIERLQAEVDNAEREYKRRVALGEVLSPSDLDTARLRLDMSTQALRRAREVLVSLTEVRPVDVAFAQAELTTAIQEEARARIDSEASVLRSPLDGRVVKIFAWPGEEAGTEGVMELARTNAMYAVAEVSESDIARVRTGQRARISGAGLEVPVTGTVERIGLKVLQNEILPVDPARFTDGRVVEVWVRVEDGRRVENLIHLRVDVVIEPAR